MTSDLLDRLERLGAHLDEERVVASDGLLHVVPSARPRHWGRMAAAAAVLVATTVGVWAVVPRDATPAADTPAPSIRNGADIVVWVRHGAAAEQVQFLSDVLAQFDLIDTSRTEYVDEAASLVVARTLLTPDEFALLAPQIPSFFRLYALPSTTDAQITLLAEEMRTLPNSIDVNPPWPIESIPPGGTAPDPSSVTTIALPTTNR